MKNANTTLETEMFYFTSTNQYWKGEPHTDSISTLGNGDYEQSVEEALLWAEENNIAILYDRVMAMDEYDNTILANVGDSYIDYGWKENDTIRIIIFEKQFN